MDHQETDAMKTVKVCLLLIKKEHRGEKMKKQKFLEDDQQYKEGSLI